MICLTQAWLVMLTGGVVAAKEKQWWVFMTHMLTYLICRKKRFFQVHMTGYLSLIVYNNLIRYFNLIKVMNQVTTIQDFWTLMSKIFWFCKIQVTFISCFRNLGKNILSNWFLVDFHYILVLNFRLIHIAGSNQFTYN